jgi:3-methyladenine DNA glycosylase AlkD
MNQSDKIVAGIRKELKRRGTTEGIARTRVFFKEEISCYGVMTPEIKEVVEQFFSSVKGNFGLALEVAEQLLKAKFCEEKYVAIAFLSRMTKSFASENFETFDHWIDYLDSWAVTDGFSVKIINPFVEKDPARVGKLLKWTESNDRWRRRAAAVSLVYSARKGKLLPEVFQVAQRLVTDEDDLVQKGVGWLLKEASKKHPQEVHDFLIVWKEKTSRNVLRYSSEKLPREMKVLKRNE